MAELKIKIKNENRLRDFVQFLDNTNIDWDIVGHDDTHIDVLENDPKEVKILVPFIQMFLSQKSINAEITYDISETCLNCTEEVESWESFCSDSCKKEYYHIEPHRNEN